MEQLAVDLTKMAVDLWGTAMRFLPRLAGALLLLLAGWLVARLLRLLTYRVVKRLGSWGSIEREMRASGVDDVAPRAISTIVYWVAIVVFFAAAGQVLGLAVVSTVLAQLARYLPSVLSGIVVVLAGVVGGNIARHAASSAARAARVAYARALGEVARAAVLSVAGLIALEQFGVNSTALVVALGLAIGGAIGGLALAFGLGSRDSVSNLLAGRQVGRFLAAGQRVRVGDVQGRVIRLEGSSVTLDTGEGKAIVPAKVFAQTTTFLVDEGVTDGNV